MTNSQIDHYKLTNDSQIKTQKRGSKITSGFIINT